MYKKVWLFKELNNGYTAIFTDLKKANIFIKYYGLKMYDLNNEFPKIDDDYILCDLNKKFPLMAYKVNPDINDAKKLFA